MILSNEDINSLIKDKASLCNEVNYIRFINKRMNDKKISFRIEYEEPKNIYTICNDNISKNEYYYGLSPMYKMNDIIEEFYNETLIDSNKLSKYLCEKSQYFMVDNKDIFNDIDNLYNDKEQFKLSCIEALYAKILLKFSLHFGYTFNVKKEDVDKVSSIINGLKNKIYIDEALKDGKIYIKGRPSNDFFNEFNFGYKYENSILTLDLNSNNLMDLYNKEFKDKNPKIGLIGKKEYYSGVLPRLRGIINEENNYNSKVDSYLIKISRTTYATLDGFTDNSILDLEVLSKYKVILCYLNKIEYQNERKLFENDDIKSAVNEFLNVSSGPLNIAVSANIKTSDGYLLYAYRNSNSIDNNTVYCSVNGQSEIADKNVDFYFNSMYEDYPTIDLKMDRIDFKQELARECVAELSLPGFEDDYEYYGISILGIDRKNGSYNDTSRIHFNILAKHNSIYKVDEIENRWRNSTEAFENKEIFGVKYNNYNSNLHILKYFLSRLSSFLIKNKKKVISSLTILFAAITSIVIPYFSNKEITDEAKKNIFKLITSGYSIGWFIVFVSLSLYGFILFSFSIYKSIKRSKRVFSIKGHYKKYNKKKKSNYSIYKEDMSYLFDFYYDKTNNKIKNKMIKILKNDKSSKEKIKKKEYQILSPISILMLALYIDDFN